MLKSSFSEKATKLLKKIPLVLVFKDICFFKTGSRLFQILWPSHYVLTLFSTQFTSLTLPTTWNLFLAWPFMTFSVTFFSFQALNATYIQAQCSWMFYLILFAVHINKSDLQWNTTLKDVVGPVCSWGVLSDFAKTRFENLYFFFLQNKC